ncbi:MAG: hypothetical protein RL023_922 [Candidatus Parcubacteria bacterium]|jgi:hypothetical protein
MERNQLIAAFTQDAIVKVRVDVNNEKSRKTILTLINNNDPQLH